MNEFARYERMAQGMKERYPEGTRITLLSMGDDPRPIPPGTRGTVNFVDDQATVHVSWDNGRSLGLVPDVDSFRALTQEELEEEKNKESESQCQTM